jgi:uncharacterized protein
MKCPKCAAPMELVRFQSIEVDRCTACKGIYFDSSEADALKKLRGSEVIDVGDAAVGEKQNANDRIQCPRDTVTMIRIVDPKQPHIWLEQCPVCSGTWFDAGEFRDWKEETLADVFRGFFAKPRS